MKLNSEQKSSWLISISVLILTLIFVFTFLFLLKTMSKKGKYETISVVEKQYEIVGVKRPKHFQLDLKDVKTGYIFKRVSVSKHCNNWQKIPLNSVHTFKETRYKYAKENIPYVRIKVESNFCKKF